METTNGPGAFLLLSLSFDSPNLSFIWLEGKNSSSIVELFISFGFDFILDFSGDKSAAASLNHERQSSALLRNRVPFVWKKKS